MSKKAGISILFFLNAIILVSQTEYSKWSAKKADYLLPVETKREAKIDGSGIFSILFTGMAVVYQKTFSDYDGDNCPFHPSCSNFFVESVRETNFIFGTLGFADRFTRDTNFFKSSDQYPLYRNKKFYDPVDNYTLDETRIIIYSPGTSVRK